MAIKINDHFLYLEIDGAFIASAKEDGKRRWKVSNRPGLNRKQAMTAMVLAERLAAGYSDEDPFVAGWREELA